MADIKVLMVTDGARFNFGTQSQSTNNPDFFGLSALVTALRSSTVPSIQVDTAHRRGFSFSAAHDPGSDVDTSVNLTYAGDFVFTSIDLGQYDVIWLIGDEGYNGGALGTNLDSKITDPEKIAIATFMQNGGGLFAVGDHDGIGQYMCGLLPRVRVMRRWFYYQNLDHDPTFAQFIPNWSAAGSAAIAAPGGPTDRFDTLQPDSGDGNFYFVDQSDPLPQQLKTSSGAPLASAPSLVHSVLRGADGSIIVNFPDHMHEGEATDFNTVSSSPPFNPNDGGGNPTSLTFTDSHGNPVSFVEFPKAGDFQVEPEVIAYGSDSGHATYLQGVGPSNGQPLGATNPKTRGVLSLYDGHAVGIGRIMTGSTFHHYLDKNLIGDPQTESTVPGVGPTGSNLGLQLPDFDTEDPTQPSRIAAHYINAVTWLAPLRPNFYFWTNKNVFGLDEVNTASMQGSTFPKSFYVVFDGIPASVVGNPTIQLSGGFFDTNAKFQQGTPIVSGNRVLFPFDVLSIPLGAFPSAGFTILTLEASATVGGTFYTAETIFELVAGADPYFTNVDPAADNVFYLSQDLRVFQATPGSAPFASFPAGAPYAYAANLIAALNGNAAFTDGSSDPFGTLHAANDLQEDTSVNPGTASSPNYYFAIAKVRLRPGGATSPTVRVFFRLFATQTNDTDFAPESTYLSSNDMSGFPNVPLRGSDNTTFPMFATSNGSAEFGPNQQPLPVPSTGESWTYFGCYLNFDISPPLPGTHHCLIAQIAYDGAPIINSNGITLSPENSDKLAQRNLQITGA
jgi:hypothetical protein